MLSPQKIEEIKTLLAPGILSQRKVAETVGVSRTVIHRIATGRYRHVTPTPKEEWISRTDEPFQRCPVCGGKVQLPCLACFLRKQPGTAIFPEPISSDFGLDLNDHQRFRYEQVKRCRKSH